MGEMIDIEKLCMGCMTLLDNKEVCPHCGFDKNSYTPSPHQLPLKTILAGKYLVGRVLGEGGFGITYMGMDLNLNLKVAIKEYYPTGFVTRETTSTNTIMPYVGEQGEFFKKGRIRFIDEARNLAKFRFLPGIVAVSDFFNENGTAYIVMEYIEGQTFKAYLAKMGGKLPAAQVFDMMRPIIDSLGEVHKKGIIHRDISPDNVMISNEGYVKLLDFGAARDFMESGNKSLSVLLKPGYAPEEQYRSKGKQGPWTDIYALCATMYRAITGAVPDESIERMSEDLLRSPSQLGIAINPEQEAALMKGLAVLQQNRFQNISQFQQSLYPKNLYPSNVTAVKSINQDENPIENPQTEPVISESQYQADKSQNKQSTSIKGSKTGQMADRRKNKRKKDRILAIVFIGIVAVIGLIILICIGSGGSDQYAGNGENQSTSISPSDEVASVESNATKTPVQTPVPEESETPKIKEAENTDTSFDYESVLASTSDRMDKENAIVLQPNETAALEKEIIFSVTDAAAVPVENDTVYVIIECSVALTQNTKVIPIHDYDFCLFCESGNYIPDAFAYSGNDPQTYADGIVCKINSTEPVLVDFYYEVSPQDSGYLFVATNIKDDGNVGPLYACMIEKAAIYVGDDQASQPEPSQEAVPVEPSPSPSTQTSQQGEYVIPYSDTVYLTYEDLYGLNSEQLRIARNEIYARHGRMFNSEDLQDYFNSQSWYYPSIPADQFDEFILSDIERYNAKFIKEYEESLK